MNEILHPQNTGQVKDTLMLARPVEELPNASLNGHSSVSDINLPILKALLEHGSPLMLLLLLILLLRALTRFIEVCKEG